MFPIHPTDARIVADEHAHRLRQDAADTFGRPSPARRVFAAWLRWAAGRLEPTAFAPRTVQP